jgi:succinoglycan biosynthesis transport protein ExoP
MDSPSPSATAGFACLIRTPEQIRKGADVNAKSNTQTAIHYELVAEPDATWSQEQPHRMIRRALRGRIPLAIILSLSLAATGVIVGYSASSPVYQSSGLVQVEGALPSVLYTTRENGVPPLFNAYVASQVTLLKSRQVIEQAANDPALQAAGWPAGPDGVAALERSISTAHRSGEQIITVYGSSGSPKAAQAAVNAVLLAYHEACIAPSSPNYGQTETTLIAREQDLEQQLQSLREQILEETDQYGQDALQSLHNSKIEELVAIDRKLTEIRISHSRLAAGEPVAETEILPETTGTNTEVARLRRQELALLAELRSLDQKYGPDHPIIRELNRQIEAVRFEIEMRTDTLRARELAAASEPAANAAAGTETAPSIAELAVLESQFLQMRDRVREETAELGRKRAAIAGLTEKMAEVNARLAKTRQRLDEIRVESLAGTEGRIQIAELGDYPVAPAIDRRRGLAAAFGLVGILGGLGLTVVLGLFDRRLRYLTDFEMLEAVAPVLTAIPDLDRGGSDTVAGSTRAVHQLRNLLEVQRSEANDTIVSITSADRGEGKTSLAAALGDSFATAGRKTLLIDADITRHMLTNELGMAGSPGLCEAIGPNEQGAKVHRSASPNLWVMPIGASRQLDPEHLSRDRLDKLFSALRTRFDAVIVDTGPVTSSIEASLVCALTDRTLLVVARNQTSGMVRSACERLNQIHATLAGLAFNRAEHAETDLPAAKSLRTGSTKPSARLLGGRSTQSAGGGRSIRLTQPEAIAGKRAA